MSVEEDSSQESSSLEGDFIVPLHHRDRFLTEDAFVAHNFIGGEATEKSCFEMTHENPFHSWDNDHQDDNLSVTAREKQQGDDNASEVSSISNDSRRRYASGVAAAAAAAPTTTTPGSKSPGVKPPPKEIRVPLSLDIPATPQWLAEDDTLSMQQEEEEPEQDAVKEEPKVATVPKIARPARVFRGVSAPSSLASAASGSHNSFHHFRDPSLSGSTAATPDYEMLGNRPRRRHHRGHSLAYSIGSLVGQSVVTAPTSASSVSPSTGSSHQHHHSKATCATTPQQHVGRNVCLQPSASFQHHHPKTVDHLVPKPPRARSRRNPMKQEMLHVLGKFSSPVKKLAAPVKKLYAGSEQKAELRRSNGCLT